MTTLDEGSRITTRGVVLVNPASGTSDTSADELRSRFAGCDVVECRPGEIESHTRAAATAGRPFVAIAGGDGTIRCAAQALVGTETALLAIPAGTHNHFAKTLGLATVDDAAEAAHRRRVIEIDVGTVNGFVFVNNSSIGTYPGIVAEREVHERRLPKPVANCIAVWKQMRAGRSISVTIDGRPRLAWLVFVGNGAYGANMRDLASRTSLTGHILDVRIVRADQRFARTKLVLALLGGRDVDHTTVVERRTCRTMRIDVRGRAMVDVALDGELERSASPLRFDCALGALRVIV